MSYLQWPAFSTGMESMPTVVFPGRYQSLSEIRDFVVNLAKKAEFNDRDIYALELAVDEACSNIIEHAYGGENRGDIELTCDLMDGGMMITIRDRGRPFNPELVPDPDLAKSLDQLEPGGAGLFLMRKMMDEVRFDFTKDHGNVLTMIKYKQDLPI